MSDLGIGDLLSPPASAAGTNGVAGQAGALDVRDAFLAILDQQLGLLTGQGLVGRGAPSPDDKAIKAQALLNRLQQTGLPNGDVGATPGALPTIDDESLGLDPDLLTLLQNFMRNPNASPEAMSDDGLDVLDQPVSDTAAGDDVGTDLAAMLAALSVMPAAPMPSQAPALPAQSESSTVVVDDMSAKPAVDPVAGLVADLSGAEAVTSADAEAGSDDTASADVGITFPDASSKETPRATKASGAQEIHPSRHDPVASINDGGLAQRIADRQAELQDMRGNNRLAALSGSSSGTDSGAFSARLTASAGGAVSASSLAATALVPGGHATATHQTQDGFMPLNFATLPGTSDAGVADDDAGAGQDTPNQGFGSWLANFDTGAAARATQNAGIGSGFTPGFQAALANARFGYPPPNEQVLMSVRQMAAQKLTQLNVQLQPVELGKISIRLEFAEGGKVRARISADQSDTLDLLKADQGGLEQALAAAGFDLDAGSMEFSLQQGNGGAEQQASSGSSGSSGQFLPSADDQAGAATEAAIDLSNGLINVKI